VLFISSELEEVLRVSDRIAVIKDRAKAAEITNDGVSVEDVMAVIAGGTP
jgi:monosaccharide-transporting ATPase